MRQLRRRAWLWCCLVLVFGMLCWAFAAGGPRRPSPASVVRIERLGDQDADNGGAGGRTAVTGPFLSETDPALEQIVRAALGERLDHYAVVVKDLKDLAHGSGVAINAERVFYGASLYKLAVMYEAFRQAEAGQMSLSTELTVTPEAVAEDLGTLEKAGIEAGDRLAVDQLIELMIVFSDNTSSVLLRDALGRSRIDQTLRALGLRSTSVGAPDLPTTAADMSVLIEAIATARGVSQGASRRMIELLLQQSVRGRIPAGVPGGVPVANKTGTWEDAGHDVAIVYAPAGTYLLVVMSDLTVRDDLIAALSREVYAYYADRSR